MFQCNQLGNNLKDVVDKYKKYDECSTGLVKWLNVSEEEARKQQSESIAADPQTLQTQLEDTKARNTAARQDCGTRAKPRCPAQLNARLMKLQSHIFL